MAWDIHEALEYYKKQGAPGDQNALLSLLTESQQAQGGSIPRSLITELAEGLAIKEALLLAMIRRIPRLRLSDQHTLELCAGPSCSRAAELARTAEILCREKNITLKFVPCMKACAKGPNLKWDGTLYHRADETLLKKLLQE